MNKRIFIGVSWPYANGILHLGHLAGQHIVVDVFRRYHKLKGNDVLMVSGSDMHGTPITIKAEKMGKTPLEFAEENHQKFLQLFKELDLEYDLYTKTHTKNHFKVSQLFAQILYKNKYLFPKTTKQFYDPVKKQFLVDRYVEGTCPYCGYFPARGDQCDNCGRVLTPTELIDTISKLSGTKPILKETTDLYFNLPEFTKQLEDWLKDKTYWRKYTLQTALGWLKEGLEPRPITRDLNWGIPVPIKGFEHKVLYVWFEAVIGYLSAAILWAKKQGNPSLWEEYWKDKNTKHYYFIAKDNIVFHALLWPAQLMAFNKRINKDWCKDLMLPGETQCSELNLPYNVVANKFLTIKGEKMSKSKGIFVTAEDLLRDYSPELVRYFFVRFAPENHDIDFEMSKLKEANNNELVATIGNLIYRSLVLAKKNYGKVPNSTLTGQETEKINKYLSSIGEYIENTQFSKSMEQLLSLAKWGNQVINETKPWENPEAEESKHAVYLVLNIVWAIRVAMYAFIPSVARKIDKSFEANVLENKNQKPMWVFNPLPSNIKITDISPIIEKII